MPIRSPKNEYRGVNAHFQSYAQAEGDWQGFHNNYITYLAAVLNTTLPDGYLVRTEKSLQIRERYPDTGERIRRPEPDLTFWKAQTPEQQTDSLASPAPAAQATLTVPVIKSFDLPDDAYLVAVVVYQTLPNARFGKPIVTIEVLSPTNKPPGDGYIQYIEKRVATLKSGLVLVEVDFLHETALPLAVIPSYRHQHPDSFPYYIAISDPRPTLEKGQTQVYGFHVDDPVPILDIPLSGKDTVRVDLGAVYNQTFESLRSTNMLVVDYAQFPDHIDRYSKFDRQRIQQRMQQVQEKISRDIN